MKNFIKKSAMVLLYLFCVTSWAQFNYGEALQKSLLFYETQQSGNLPDWNRINWRSDAGVNDGKDVGLDLTGGWHDAGDHVKFGFPMAFSVTALNWGFLEYEDGYDRANQTEIFKRNIKWVTDYFIKCHPTPNEFYAQVADSKSQDHNFWMAPEMVDVHPQYGQRKSYKLSPSKPGTEVACETAAALASASIIFKDSDPAYSATLLRHAKELYEFGDANRGLYHTDGGIPADGTYSSQGFQDELTWGALWLYKATGDQAYLDKAEAEYTQPDFLWSLVWDDKSYGNMVLLSIITGKDAYKADAEKHLDFWQNGGGISYSPGGQAHLTQWGSLRHAMNASLTALIYSDNVATPKKTQYHDFAVSQVNYALGNNPNNRSLVTGFGVNPPTKPHHRGQHASWTRSSANPVESRHTLWGALMGGPSAANDAFEEDRDDFQANEVATDYNACYQGVLARMIMEFGGTPLSNFPQPETPGLEFINEVKLNNDQSRFTEVSIWLNNRSAWPARVPDRMTARYFVDISEGVAAGFGASDYGLTARGAGTTVGSNLIAWDASQNIYYAEIEVDQDKMPFPGGQGEYRSEIQLRVALPANAPVSAWDPSNDFSYSGLSNTLGISENVPVYVNGILAGGKEPTGGEIPTASFTATPESGTAPLEVSFDAAASSDPNGDAITYSWDFGNGETSSVVDPLITYTDIGSYLVTLIVSDGTNTSSEFTTTITVADGNTAPVADFTAAPTSGVAPVTVSFNASASSDANGDSLTYVWDFGDGTTGSGVTIDHEYDTIGEYNALLTVSDGSKEDTETITITVTDGSPIASFTVSTDSGAAPLDVTFDASASVDPTGGVLTYSWDFGNGETASTATAATTYTTIGEATVTLTVTNAAGATDSDTKTITVTDGSVSCAFGTPTVDALPTINSAFENIFVLGNGGPSLDNVTNFTINWDLANNGLYQFSMSTSDGNPSYYNDFLPKVTQNFNTAQPEITITNSGITGLDGSYWATVDNSNFVLVSKTGGFTMYFSSTTTAPGCDGPPPSPTAVDGGVIAGGPFVFTVGDGIADNVSGISLTGNIGANSQWVVTDDQGNILGLPPTPEAVDFDGAGAGICLIWHLSYEDGLQGAAVGNNASDLQGTFDLSNSITVTRNTQSTGGDCTFETPVADALPTINATFQNIFVLGNGGPNLDNVTDFTINWDLANNGLYQFSMNTNDGNPSYYNDFLPKVTQNFNAAQPGVTIADSGFTGLDGSYWATVDNGNFVLVSKTGGFTIYFSTATTAPDCGSSPSVDGGVIAGGPFVFTVGDGVADNVSGVTLTGNVGETSQWIVTDDQGKILGLPPTPEAVDFDGAGAGSCFIYSVTYNGTITGLAADENISGLAGVFDLSNSIEVVRNPVTTAVDGGVIAGGPFVFTVGDGIADNVSGVTLTGNVGETSQWIVTDDQGKILGLPPTPEAVDFDGAGVGSCFIYNVSYNGPITGLTADENISGLAGTFDLSNSIEVVRNAVSATVDGGTVATDTGATTVTTTTGDGIDDIVVFANTSSSTESYIYLITDESGNILTTETASHNFEGASVGICKVYGLSYTGALDVSGKNVTATDLSSGEFSLSGNAITVTREDVGGGGGPGGPGDSNPYIERFVELRNELYDPANGYFSADGSPHHSIETLLVEAPDYGHESTSELYSYWLWLEVMNGRITNDWEPLSNVWDRIEEFIIPTTADQPTNGAYNPSSPAAYASEFALPSMYPAPLVFNAPVGTDPVSPDLTATYGDDIYQMHWLLDNDNFYGYGNRGDGVSTPSYINTFQRGEQESVYETIPHPSWESFDWGGSDGFLPLFVEDQNYAKQWRYTSAPDADARAVQAMYWAKVYAEEQGTSLATLDLDKATKMGDFLRLAMFDKYFKPLGVQSATNGAGTGYDSAHYLMSWYMSWGGSADTASPWAFRISSSHCHFGYQNPVAAYALTQVDELKPKSQNGERDWNESLTRQMEFYTWLQSKEGAIAGGATNSWNGDYSAYPAGKSTFYDMAFDTDPVYHDPGSGTWFGWQAWSMERVAEYYYITNDPMAKNLMDKWTAWVKSEVKLIGTDDFEIPATLEWSGEPDTWDPNSPGSNDNLSVEVTNYSQDLGVAASMAKALIYYAAATEKHATLDTEARDLAKEVLDRMWNTYRDDKGVSAPEERGDFSRIFDEEVYVPGGFTGVMGNGDEIKPGVSFLDIRSGYKNDPDFARLEAAYNAGEPFTQRYHRSWAQMEVALANAEYGFFFGGATTTRASEVTQLEMIVSPNPANNYIDLTANFEMKDARVTIIDIAGNVIRKESVNSRQKSTRLSIDDLSTGLYILEIYDVNSGKKFRNKLIKN
ncbi:glycoside hydrolase family 48 protein [Aquimarina sp. RZ0]|uniref:glycoside hydrolase family 48 protein n=1 Tax=Aquimarina sp. RZ0 TaxID=2607730 RepID=UPI00165FBB16|nr:glycoside hydrolase family 48 protein [Aquimarina sp. RZ0]